MTVFIVPRTNDELFVGESLGKLGQRAAPTCAVFINLVFVPEDHRLGQEGGGFNLAMAACDHSRPMVPTFGLGLIECCIDDALPYAKERSGMGKWLIDHQTAANSRPRCASDLRLLDC